MAKASTLTGYLSALILTPLLGAGIAFFGTVLFICGLMMRLLPAVLSWSTAWRRYWKYMIQRVEQWWLDYSLWLFRLFLPTHIELTGDVDKLSMDNWYILFANHRTWLDIVMLDCLLKRRMPSPRFFLKQSLIWVPFIGQTSWAIGHGFLKRHSVKTLRKQPHRKGEDLAAIRYYCELFKLTPTTMALFPEGTRYTLDKSKRRNSPYQHLLRPHWGGIATLIQAMMPTPGITLVDTTIQYAPGDATMWQFLCGHVAHVRIHITCRKVKADMVGDFQQDRVFRQQFQTLTNDWWQQKDQRLATYLKEK